MKQGTKKVVEEIRLLQQLQEVCRLDSSDPVYIYVAVVLFEHNSVWLLLLGSLFAY